MNTPLVSVIMNVRNGAATLRETLDSLLVQTFVDWELIFWDDHSTDESAQILSEYPDPRIQYFLAPTLTPLGAARQAAIRQAQGAWLAFLDQDDIWLRDKLRSQLALIENDARVGIVYGRTVLFAEGGREVDFDHRHEYVPLPEGEIFATLFRDSCFISMSSAMIRRSAILALGELPEIIQTTPDYYYYVGVARRNTARAVQEVVCRYRWHSRSMTRNNIRRLHDETLWVIDHWAPCLDPQLVAWRRRVHNTCAAVADMTRLPTFVAGIARLLKRGSAPYLFSRPFARGFRALRRRIRRPRYLNPGTQRDTDAPTPPNTETGSLTLSVIIVSWNVCDLLRDCLRSLYKEMIMPPKAWEVIVWDNGSSDGSAGMIAREFPNARLVAGRENLGFGRANNRALALCRGTLILLLNPDTLVVDHALDRMMDILQSHPDVGALGCQLQNADGSFQRWTGGNAPGLGNVICHFLGFYRVIPARLLPPPVYLEAEPAGDVMVGWVSGACMLLRRRALAGRIFDARFFLYGEDLDLCSRLIRAGWKVMYTPRAKIVHYEGRSFEAQTPEIQMNRIRSLREVYAMRNGSGSLVVYDIVVLIGFLMRTIGFAVAACLRPNRRFGSRARMRGRYLLESARLLFHRRTRAPVDQRNFPA